MRKYYIHNGQQQEGPYDKEELRAKVVKATTMVWYEGLADWNEAGKVDELKDLFSTPPPFMAATATPPPRPAAPAPTPHKSNSVWKWLRIGAGLLLLGFLIAALVAQNRPRRGPSNYHEQVMTVEETERQDPARFLSVEGKYRTNFWGDQMVIEGTIVNTATVATYKDAVVQVRLMSETDTEIDRGNYVIYKKFPPHGSVEFSIRVERPKVAKKVQVDMVSATATY